MGEDLGFNRKVGHPANRARTRRLTALLVVGWLVMAGLGAVAVLNAQQLAHEVADRQSFHQRVAAARLLHIAALETEDAFERYLDSGDAGDLALLSELTIRLEKARRALVERLGDLPQYADDLAEVGRALDGWMAAISSAAAQRPSLDPDAASQSLAQWLRDPRIGGLSAQLTSLAEEVETQWAEVDLGIERTASALRLGVVIAAAVGLSAITLVLIAAWREARLRARALARVEATEAYNRGLIEGSLDGMLTVDPDGIIADVNEAMCRLSGSSRAELVGSRFPAWFSDPGRAATGLALAFGQGAVADYELTLRPRGRAEVQVSFNAATYRDPATGEVKGIIATARDVTEARRLQRSLADQQAYTRGLIEASLDALATIDQDGRITDVNRRMELLTGASRGELIGSPFDGLFRDPAAAREGVRRVLALGRVTDYELVVTGRDGREVPVSYNATTYFDAAGDLQGVFAAARDITARERALQQANLSLQAFAYSVSHDLRAPLRALSGFSEALVEEYSAELGEVGRDYAERIQRASERMGLLIDDLLHLSVLARAELHIEPVDLSGLARSVAEELQQREPRRTVTFQIADGEWAQADARLIRTVLENLLGNALKFTSRRADARIEFGGAPADPGWRTFYVRDNGAGFDPAYKERLFRPFERLHSATDFPGSGIGLASVARIVERHGGRVSAHSDPDQGTTFSFTLRTDRDDA